LNVFRIYGCKKTKKSDITLSSGATLLPSHDLMKFITKIPQSKLPKKEMKKRIRLEHGDVC